MISKITELPRLKVETMSLARIYAQDNAFSGTVLENDFWVQKTNEEITAVISSDGGSMNIWCDKADYGELREFISALGPSVIFTEYENAEPLSIKPDRIRNMLTKRVYFSPFEVEEFSLCELYDGLDRGSDVDIHLPDFDVFAPDVSHRLRHNAARAVVKEYGAALAFTYFGGAVMSGIALSPEYRGKGFGKALLSELLSRCDGDFFVAANDENTKFYLRNGFELRGEICFGKQEI